MAIGYTENTQVSSLFGWGVGASREGYSVFTLTEALHCRKNSCQHSQSVACANIGEQTKGSYGKCVAELAMQYGDNQLLKIYYHAICSVLCLATSVQL